MDHGSNGDIHPELAVHESECSQRYIWM